MTVQELNERLDDELKSLKELVSRIKNEKFSSNFIFGVGMRDTLCELIDTRARIGVLRQMLFDYGVSVTFNQDFTATYFD